MGCDKCGGRGLVVRRGDVYFCSCLTPEEEEQLVALKEAEAERLAALFGVRADYPEDV